MGPDSREPAGSPAEDEIREFVEDFASGIRAKDPDRIVTHYAPDTVMFILAPPLRYTPKNSPGKKGVEDWLSSFEGPIGYEIRDLTITAADDVAFCHSLNRISGTRSGGEKTDIWIRETLCLRRLGDGWKIAHQHESVPFYMDGSGRAATDLEP